MPVLSKVPPGYVIDPRFTVHTQFVVLRWTGEPYKSKAEEVAGPFTRRYTAVQAAWRHYNAQQPEATRSRD